MNQYIYETHLHTSTSSACGRSLGSEYISYYKEKGYAGIIVTDHFFNGNCAVPRDLPWEEKVKRFVEGYKIAKEEGDKQGFDVFFGWEDCFRATEYLVYGLDEEWLLNNPDIMQWDDKEHFERIDAAGGLVVQAHPFRERDYIEEVRLHPLQSHAWEVCNAGNSVEEDYQAYKYAKDNNIIMTAGSDIHLVGHTNNDNVTYGVSFPYKLNSIADYVRGIKNRDGKIYVPNDNLSKTSDYRSVTPTYLYDSENKRKRFRL